MITGAGVGPSLTRRSARSFTERKLGPVRLANPKMLPEVLTGRGKAVLPQEDVELIRRQLETLCRNVEF